MSKTYYCKRCDSDGHSLFHRCFFIGKTVRPLLKKPEVNPSTPLAKKLAAIYEKEFKMPFPGGIDNAYIHKEAPATFRAWRDQGSWGWWLKSRDPKLEIQVREFGSGTPASTCAKRGVVMDD